MGYRLGIDIGGTKIGYGVLNDEDKIIFRHKTYIKSSITQDEFCNTIYEDVNNILESLNLKQQDFTGMALAFPGYVNFDEGYVVFTPSILNISQFPARERLSRLFPHMKVVIENDVNVAAIAEHKYGAGKGFDHMTYIAIGTGVGNGLILNGNIYRGAYGGAGELGHMLIRPDEGVYCGCGNKGCFMSFTSGSNISKHARVAIEGGEETILTEITGGDLNMISAEHINEAFQKGDILAKKMIDQIGYYLGIYVYNIFMGININCYVFGGGMADIGQYLLDKIWETFDRYNHLLKDQKIYLKYAELGSDAGIIGAAEALREKQAER